jgi:hypothetical protein
MEHYLQRIASRPDGIASVLFLDGFPRFCCLEHAYDINGFYHPKLSPGIYTCRRGQHKLKTGGYLLTYEICNVLRDSGILFHYGNLEQNSEGCILVGKNFDLIGSQMAVMNTRTAWQMLMDFFRGKEWTLEVVV